MYYLWRLLGYKHEQITYRTEAEFLTILDEVNEQRKQAQVLNNRLKTRFHDDAVSKIKNRWHGVAGLDGEIVTDSSPSKLPPP